MDRETVEATIECFERGALTSATIMPNMPATEAAVAFALNHPEFSFGVHLTFVGRGEERPLSDPTQVPALVTEQGCFPASQSVRLRAMARRLPIDQIEREMEAQLGRLRDMGLTLSHVDSHCHIHKFAPFMTAMERVLPRFGISKVRAAQDWYISRQFGSPTYWYGRVWKRRIQRRFRTTDHFFMPANTSDSNSIETLISRVGTGTVEVGGHPGRAGWRQVEGGALERFSALASSSGHSLISWNDV
jgi:predicted glycoside hydrolase/deacetylase ChbG (UPF0249 family)